MAITDDLGRFTLTRPEAERTTLQVDAVGYGPATLLLKSHGIARERTIHLAREATLEVAVVGVKDAAARVARVTCSVGELAAAGEFLAGPAIEWLAHVGPDGIARVEHLPAGATLTLELIEDEVVRRRHTRPLRLAPGERARVELDLDRGLALTGVLATTGGVPVAAQELWLVPAGMRGPMNLASRHVLRSVHARATTDASGTYRIEDVPAGEWVLGPAPPLAPRDAALAPIGHWFRAPRNARTLTLDLVAMPGTYLEGEVVDEDGEPAPHVPLTYRTVFEDGSVHARADEAGRFRLGPLGPGPYEVTALADRARGHAGSAPTLAANARDPLQLVVHAGVDLHVSGVREDDGRLAPLVHAFVTRVGKTPALVATHRSSYGETTLTLGPVEAGQVAVAVATRDGWCGVLEDVDIRAGETAPERLITLRPGARLELRHRGLRTLRVRVLAGPVVVESATLEPGAVQTLTLPEGKVVVEVEDGTGEIERHRLRLLPNGEMTLALPR